jgi:hypothetical protein
VVLSKRERQLLVIAADHCTDILRIVCPGLN